MLNSELLYLVGLRMVLACYAERWPKTLSQYGYVKTYQFILLSSVQSCSLLPNDSSLSRHSTTVKSLNRAINNCLLSTSLVTLISFVLRAIFGINIGKLCETI